MCHRCVVNTFLLSALLGASVAFFGARYFLEHRQHSAYTATRPESCNTSYHTSKPIHAPTQTMTPSLPTKIAYNFPRASLQDVTRFIGTYTRRTFIFAPNINPQQEVTFISQNPATIAETYKAFLKLLDTKGLALYPQGHKGTLTLIAPKRFQPPLKHPHSR